MDEPKRPPASPGTPSPPVEQAGRAAQERGGDLARQAQAGAAEVTRKAGDHASSLAEDAQNRAGQVAGVAQDRAHEVLQKARDAASGVASSVQERFGDAVGDRRDQAAGAIDTAAERAHKAADTLRDANQSWLSGIVGSSADELGAFAEMIRTNDLNGLMQRAQGLAHRQPALFAGASVVAGFALARMVRFAMEQPSGYRPSLPAYRTSQPSYATGASGPGGSSGQATQFQPQVQSASVQSPTPGRPAATTPPAATYPGTTYNG
ncbi:MAG: hypothetical protein JOY66_06595 [Acetobacteraceae bacterium]|nr:hypothetical protein [Acetobacteraceae bacterium]